MSQPSPSPLSKQSRSPRLSRSSKSSSFSQQQEPKPMTPQQQRMVCIRLFLIVPLLLLLAMSFYVSFHHTNLEGLMEDQTILAMEKALIQAMMAGSSSKKQLPIQNHAVIRRLLQSDNQADAAGNNIQWKNFARMTHVNGTVLALLNSNTTNGQTSVAKSSLGFDMTQNVHRVEDFMKPSKDGNVAKEDRDEAAKKQREMKQNDQTGGDGASGADSDGGEKKEDPLNVILFYADDWTMEVIGALNEYVQTPNIDAMAEDGMLFTRNCVTTSICWISRNTLATGTYSAVHKTNNIADMDMFNKSLPWLETLYPQLKANGYYTALLGKWHAQSPQQFMKEAFDLFQNYYGSHWMHRQGKMRHITDLNGEDALAFLQKKPFKDHKNFFLKISFFATHAWDGKYPPYQPMNESMTTLYVNDTIPMPKTATPQYYAELPYVLKSDRNEAMKRNKDRFNTPEHYQDKIKNLYRMATEVDAVVGAVIDELKEQGLYEKTLLIFTTDNGNLHGQHGLSEKWFPFEESLRVPLVIRDPRMPEHIRGTRNDEFTLNVDLAPTILSAAAITPPSFMQGRDISQLYLNPEETLPTWRQDFFYEWTTGEPMTGDKHMFNKGWIPSVFALVRKDYKYFYWPEERFEQLYNVEHDPFDEHDVINATTTKQVLQLMRARYAFLKQWAQSGMPV